MIPAAPQKYTAAQYLIISGRRVAVSRLPPVTVLYKALSAAAGASAGIVVERTSLLLVGLLCTRIYFYGVLYRGAYMRAARAAWRGAG